MPKIHTHLHLALKLSKKINISDVDSFFLGSAYPDAWKTSTEKSLQYHYKKEAYEECNLEAFMKNEPMDDFNLGYYFHLWIDNRILETDTSDINKQDCLICDMEGILPMIQHLRELKLSGKRYEAFQNILCLESEPMLLYRVPEMRKKKYEEILDKLVNEFIKELCYDSTYTTQ